jgi:hypothetical protein
VKEWFRKESNIHYLIYIFCTLVWYVVNLFRVNGTGGQWAFANEFIGFTVFLILAIRYGLKSFLKWIYVPVIGVSAAAFLPVFRTFAPQNDYSLQFVARYVNSTLLIILLIRAFFYFIKEEKRERSFRLSACFVIWAIMILACIASKSKSSWPMWAAIALGSFYVIPSKKKENDSLINGLVDGIIINFFIYQGLALLHRPYEVEWVRYCSFFSNSDCSAKFFTVSYIGFLVKYLMLRRKESKKWLQVLCFMFASSMWGFWFFTMTRSGFLGMGFATLFFLVIKILVFGEKKWKFVSTGILIVLIAVASVPVIYLAIRYIPALRHHPIFIGEYSETRVHSWDPINSDKYATPEDVIAMYAESNASEYREDYHLYNRIRDINNKYVMKDGETAKTVVEASKPQLADVLELAADGERVLSYTDGITPGSDENHPAFIKKSYKNFIERKLGIRKYVYAYYFNKSGFRGNEEEYVSGVVLPNTVYTSAHNSTLDFMSRYGYIAGALFLALQIAVFMSGLIQIKKFGSNADMGIILATLTSAAFFAWGLFYSVAFTGEIMDTLFWISATFAMKKKLD